MQEKRMPSRARVRPRLVPRTVTTRPRTATRTSPASTPGSSSRTRIFSPSSTMSTLGSHAEEGATTGLLLSTKRVKSRLTSRCRRESSIIGPKSLSRRTGPRSGSFRSRSGLRVGAAQERFQLAQELVHVLELTINGREADVGDLVELPQPVHDSCPDVGRTDLPFFGVVETRLDLVHDRVELRRRDRPFLAGLDEPGAQLLPIESFPAAVLLDDHVGDLLDRLVRRKPAPAGFAFPSPPDDLAFPALP